jgi:hypothetical protein
MTFRSVILSSYESYLDDEHAAASREPAGPGVHHLDERERFLAAFPHSVLLQLSYPELDYANRWCWQQFGPAHGECYQASSEYRACDLQGAHSHEGTWVTCWLEKIDYDFGYNAWYFAQREDMQRFLQFVPEINWGESYPK